MRLVFAILQIAAASSGILGEVDSICRERCEALAVQDGTVRYINQWPPERNLALGKYASEAQPLLPKTEAPVRDLRSNAGWRIVVSAYLDHDQDDILTHIRFFDPRGRLETIAGALMDVIQTRAGAPFGGNDEIFAITSNEEHAYNSQTEIWFLPHEGRPRRVLGIDGTYLSFTVQAASRRPGVTIARETYDGVHAETKRTVQEFWTWNPERKTLTGPPK